MAYEVGQRIGDYEVLALLGSGGMGRVYKVRSVISNREEAMKVLLPDFAAEADLSARFMAEIRVLAGLDHPNIAQLRTAFQSQNEFVMIMEYVEGTTLETMASTSKIPIDQVLEYSMQVLSALSYAHGRGVIHRDMKPANVMVTPHGLVKLMDFGIAKSSEEKDLTRPGTTMGSVYYISPEQVRGGTVDARSDIYSYGVTMYEMLTGQKPFQAETSYSVLYAQLNEAPTLPMLVNPAVPAGLNDIVMHAMEKNPDARFQTADEFRSALKALAAQQAAPVAPAAGYAPVAAVAAVGAAAAPLSATAAMSAAGGVPAQGGYAPVAAVAQQAAPAPAAYAPVAVAPQQGYAPVAAGAPVAASAPVAPRPAKSHRGLWIALGAVAAILALVAVATVLPRVYAIYASQKAAASQQTATVEPAAQPAASQPATQPGAPATDATATATPPSTEETITLASPTGGTASSAPAAKASSSGGASTHPASDKKQMSTGSASTGAAPAAVAPSAPALPSGPSPQEIREMRDRFMNMDARVGTVESGVQQLRRQQQAQGMDIRSDMLASMNRMNNYMGEANRALGEKDLQTANEYLERADKELSKLESFLGK
jgi:serine/threonine-protein kinase